MPKRSLIAVSLLCYLILSFSQSKGQLPFFRQFSKSNGLPGNNVHDLLSAEDGKVWVATNKGLAFYAKSKFQRPNQPKSLMESDVLLLHEGPSKKIWAVSSEGRIFYGNAQKGFKQLTIPNELTEEISNRIPNAINVVSSKELYISTVIGGSLYRLRNGNLSTPYAEEYDKYSFFLQEHSSKGFMYGSHGGFPPKNQLRFSSSTNPEFVVQFSNKSGFSKSSFIQLISGRFLYAKDNEVIHMDHSRVIQRRILTKKIEALFESGDEKIWVGLNGGGVVCYLTNSMSSDLSSTYLEGQTVTAIAEDISGNSWFATLENGVYLLPGEKEISYQTPKIILPPNNNQNKADETNAAFPTAPNDSDKAGILEGTRLLPEATAGLPTVYISKVTINDADTTVEDFYQLNHNQNFIKVNFAGLVNNQPKKLQYRYRLNGLDTGWTYTDLPSAQYAKVLPGEYVFSVYAMNNDGFWSKTSANTTFVISPPFWNTSIFYATLTIVILLFAILALFWGLRRSREKAKTNKQRLINELQVLRSQMNPHFTFNTLSSIQHFIGNNDNDAAMGYLSKFAKLLRSIMENTKKPAIPIKDELNALELYMDLERLRLNGKFDFKIEMDPKIDAQYDHIPSLLIQPYVENAIWHGFKNKKDKGMIKVSLRRKSNYIVCEIEDNGIGRDAAKQLNGNRGQHNSMGMEITKERLEIINALKNSPLSVNIEDLQHNDGTALGTRVEIFIPVEED